MTPQSSKDTQTVAVIVIVWFSLLLAFFFGSGASKDPSHGIPFVLFFAVAGLIYIIPSWVAAKRAHPSFAAILVVNLTLGWTLLGYIVSLAWALSKARVSAAPPSSREPSSSTNTLVALERLAALKQQGVISESEFEDQKANILRAS
ncbi:MAG: superinfection immunity protein, partial [Verrucomicrobiota bacterium]|jgi:hypothetical protein|nr:superinfection immunity protein [Verrucomicrobiota bacterium]